MDQTKIKCIIEEKGSCVIDFVVLKKESRENKCIPILGLNTHEELKLIKRTHSIINLNEKDFIKTK